FRNHREVSLQVGPGLTAVVGPNGRGKTNLLEAMYYLCWLVSPRVSIDLPLVRTGGPSAYLRGAVECQAGRLLLDGVGRAGEPPGRVAWGAARAGSGGGLPELRTRAMERLGGRAGAVFAHVAGEEEALVVGYRPSVDGGPNGMQDAFLRQLAERRQDELTRR